MSIRFLLFFLLFAIMLQAQSETLREELVVFTDPLRDSEFTKNMLQELEQSLQEQSIPVRFIDVRKDGAPQEVGFTPFIVYRNHLGHKVYKGRYTTQQRLLNFIRTVRHLPEAPIAYEEENVFTWEFPKAWLVLKPKITDLSGHLPPNMSNKEFRAQALEGLQQGFGHVSYKKKQGLTDSDEMMYTNFYPYRADDGTYYVSLELYSHYDCHTPIYQQYDLPAKGTSIREAFSNAAKIMHNEVKRQITDSNNGDAMNFLPVSMKITSWEALNLPIIQQPERNADWSGKVIDLPKNWIFEGPVEEGMPVLTFNFPAPLRHYGGELKAVTGRIQLQKNDDLKKAKGSFEVETASLKMGQAELDEYVLGSVLNISEHPTAQLDFQTIVGDQLDLQLGRITTAEVKATLTMVNKSSPVTAVTQFEPFLTQDGELRLNVSTQFTAYNLTGNYNIEGPDGPAKANNQLLFIANFIMRPASGGK